jgi:hypothetical protein
MSPQRYPIVELAKKMLRRVVAKRDEAGHERHAKDEVQRLEKLGFIVAANVRYYRHAFISKGASPNRAAR